MNEFLKKFLASMGLSAASIAKIETAMKLDETEQAKFPTDLIITEYKEMQKTLLENDADFIAGIKGPEKAKQLSIVERLIKQTFELTPEETKDKTIENIITLAKEKTGKSKSKTENELQTENVSLKAELKKVREEEIPAIEAKVSDHIKSIAKNAKLKQLISSKELREGIDIDGFFPAIESYLNEKYQIDTDDQGEIKIVDKVTKLQPKNTDGTKILTADDIITERLEKHGVIKKSNADDNKKKITAPVIKKPGQENQDGPVMKSGHLSEAEKNLEELGKIRKTNDKATE